MRQAQIYKGKLFHLRTRPKRHSFSQKMFYVSLNVDDLKSANKAFFGIERPNLLSFYSKDHARLSQRKNKSKVDLRAWAEVALKEAGADFKPAQIWLTSFPRVMGYVFNPISFWHCYDEQQNVKAIICEVNNTFGETHSYVLTEKDFETIKDGHWFSADKAFHVSPLFDVKGRYDFRFSGHPLSDEDFKVDIFYYENQYDQKPIFTANFSLKPEALTSIKAFKLIFEYPLLTMFVVANIHYQAFKIWRKKARFFRKPAPPQNMFSEISKETKKEQPNLGL